MKRTKQSTFAKRERSEKSTGFAPVGGENMTHTATHTPGPWAVEPRQWDHGASLAIVAPHNGHIVAIIPFDEDIQIVDEPDAAMLAAAPTMYEALQLAAVMHPHNEMFKQALAQAEGRQYHAT